MTGCWRPRPSPGSSGFKASGRLLIMVTGRELDELKTVCPRLDLFEMVVAENGAVLFDPESGEEVLLTAGPSAELVAAPEGRRSAGTVGRALDHRHLGAL